MWVCVSEEFDKTRLVRDVVKEATKQDCGADGWNQMVTKLQDALSNKKFLLVLDDVWENGQVGVTSRKWSELKTVLNVGAKGSRIIVTTRSDMVANLVGSIHMHRLQGLLDEDCMSLFMKVAFPEGKEEQYPHLKKYAQEIVKKCGGVPLALTTVGSLLSLKREVQEWEQVKDNDIWELEQGDDDILPALRLSYNALPSYLKPCFAYCALFPKDYVFHSEILFPMWMAEGFLQSSSNGENQLQGYQEICYDYMRQLCCRCLFQKTSDPYSPMSSTCFKMHDLVHDLAISVAEVECSSSEISNKNASELTRVRHVSLTSNDFKNPDQFPEFMLQLHKVRSVLYPAWDRHSNIDDASIPSFAEKCISRFKYLRVLNLSFACPEVLPISIGNLSHLRYLNLSDCRRIQMLPSSICKLQNLQVLILVGCYRLKKLPRDIGNLISLVHLEITTNEKCLPQGIGGLTSLQVLWVRDCENLESLGEGIQCLTNLQKLFLFGCTHLQCFPVNMKRLTKLHTLCISFCYKFDLFKSGKGIHNLRSFYIGHLKCEALPDWLQDSATTLQYMHVDNCVNLRVLPEWLQNLTLLERIMIVDCSQLLALPEGMHHLTALRELNIYDCSRELRERCTREQGLDWAKIAHVPNITLYNHHHHVRL